MIIASIDIGTNTILLLVAEVNENGNISPLHNEYRIPRIGKGLKPGLPISSEKILLLENILSDYKDIANSFNSDIIIATATNAFRIASNAQEIVSSVKEKLNVDINVIIGEEEAEYSFYGIADSYTVNKNILVIDIGGGSTEIIIGNDEGIKYKKSFPIGAVSGTEAFFHHAPPSSVEVNYFNKELDKIFNELENLKIEIDKAVAIAGTPTTLACIKLGLNKFDEEIIEGNNIKSNELKDLVKVLKNLTPLQLIQKFNSIVKGREDIILTGSYILSYLLELFQLDEVIVSTRGIRYGAIYKHLKNYS